MQGIPAVKAFRDGEVVDEFVGAVPQAKVEAFFDSLLPSQRRRAARRGDELSLREAAELEPRRADIAVAPRPHAARARGGGGGAGRRSTATRATSPPPASPPASRLAKAGIGTEAFAALDRGEREAALDALLDARRLADSCPRTDPAEARELLRRAVVGILSELDPADPDARDYRRGSPPHSAERCRLLCA